MLLCDNAHSGGQSARAWRAPQKSLWQTRVEGWVRSAPILRGELLYVTSLGGYLTAIDARTGKVRWRFKTAAPIHSTPSLSRGHVLVTSDDGTLYSIDWSNGAKSWEITTESEVWASPIISNGAIFFGDAKGRMH